VFEARWFNSRRKTIRNYGGKCLHARGDSHNQVVVWYNCNTSKNQGWRTDQTKFIYPRQPFNDGVKFQIRSRMRGGKAVFYREHIGGNRFRLRIHQWNPEDRRQWFTFDRRTLSIRSFYKRGHAISPDGWNWNDNWACIRPMTRGKTMY
jgi:hypothetical protein